MRNATDADVFLAGGLPVELAARRQPSGEERLLAAVLALAIADARRGDRSALAWLASDDDVPSRRGFSFMSVCHVLGVDPAWARARIAQQTRPPRRVVSPAPGVAA